MFFFSGDCFCSGGGAVFTMESLASEKAPESSSKQTQDLLSPRTAYTLAPSWRYSSCLALISRPVLPVSL